MCAEQMHAPLLKNISCRHILNSHGPDDVAANITSDLDKGWPHTRGRALSFSEVFVAFNFDAIAYLWMTTRGTKVFILTYHQNVWV